jgi:hypothetical protein
MGSAEDRNNFTRLNRMFPGADIRIVSARECREDAHKARSMEPFFKIVDEVELVAVAAYDASHITAGVFSEAQHALHQGKKVLALMPEGAKVVRSLHPVRHAGETKQHSGAWARMVLR